MKTASLVKKMTLTSVLSALFVVLSVFLTMRFGKTIEVSWTSLPIFMSVIWLPYPYALCVAVIGSFLEQLLTYGLCLSTFIWMLPVVLQSLIFFLLILQKKHAWQLILAIALSEFVLTFGNVAAQIVDGIVTGYPYYWIYATIPLKIVNCCVRMAMSVVAVPILTQAGKRILR